MGMPRTVVEEDKGDWGLLSADGLLSLGVQMAGAVLGLGGGMDGPDCGRDGTTPVGTPEVLGSGA